MSSSAARPVRPLTCSRRDLMRIGWLVAAYVAIRAVGVLMLHAGVHAGRGEQRPGGTLDELGSWDGDWYARIAVDGYPDELSLVSVRDDTSGALVFPPLYPMLMRVLMRAGLFGLAGVVILALLPLIAREHPEGGSLMLGMLLGCFGVGAILGAALVLSATLGDLVESQFKRDLGIKDMSALLPGHGGIMDRLDSALPSAVVTWVVLAALL